MPTLLKTNRKTILIAAAAIVLAAVALIIILGQTDEAEPEFSLPTPSPATDAPSPPVQSASSDVSPENVLAVLDALRRAEAYEREMEFTTHWPGGKSTVSITVRADGPALRVTREGGGETRDVLVDGETYCVTYGGSGGYYHGSLGDDRAREVDELMQLISFEGIQSRPGFEILDAGFVDQNGEACIYMEYTYDSGLEYTTRVYVGIEHGLVVAEETRERGELAFSMKTIKLELTTPPESDFEHRHD